MATKFKGQLQNASIVERATQRAREHVPLHKTTYDSKEVELFKLRGRIGEELAQERISGANINDLSGKSNFANYDLISKEQISSVKVKGLTERGEPRYADYNKYFQDIVNPESKANQRAAQDMLSAINEKPKIAEQLPSELAGANTPDKMAHAMASKSILQIPYDQVSATSENIYNRILSSPSKYGIDNDSNYTDIEAQARNLVNDRIQPIADDQYSSHDIGKMAENAYEDGHSIGVVDGEFEGAQSSETSLVDQPTTEKPTTEAAKSAGKIAGETTGVPLGAEIGKATGEAAGEAQYAMAESVGQSTEAPLKAVEETAAESPAKDASEADEQQYYGYGH